ncbi:NupC/NupG family nucleoside CNT transporter, partial [Chromobacterium piscinae]
AFGAGFAKVLSFSGDGARFIFGDLSKPSGKLGFLFAFTVLPVIIFFSAFSALLYHFGILQ